MPNEPLSIPPLEYRPTGTTPGVDWLLSQNPGLLHYVDTVAGQTSQGGFWEAAIGRARMNGETVSDQVENDLAANEAQRLQQRQDEAIVRMKGLADEIAEASKDMDDAQFEELQRQIGEQIRNRPQMPDVESLMRPQAPSIGQSVAAGLGALLVPDQAAAIASQPFLYQQEQARLRTDAALQRHREALAEQDDLVRWLMSRADSETRRQAADRAARIEGLKAKMDVAAAELDRSDRESARLASDANAAFSRYTSGTNPAAIRAGAARLRELGDPRAPTQEEESQALKRFETAALRQASALFKDAIRELSPDDYVPQSQVSKIEAHRARLAEEFGIDGALLGPVNTEETRVAQLRDMRLRELEIKLPFLSEKERLGIAYKQASIDFLKDRKDSFLPQQSFNNQMEMNRFNLAKQRWDAQQAEAQSGLSGDVAKKIGQYEVEIAGLEEKRKAASGYAAKKQIDAQIAERRGRIKKMREIAPAAPFANGNRVEGKDGKGRLLRIGESVEAGGGATVTRTR